jgi:methylase of polypeptide subunit release factors
MLLGCLFIALLLLILSIWIGAIYVPSVDWAVVEMIRLANIRKGEIVVDLGSGNGKILIALAKKGIEAHGYEINPFLVVWSWFLIWKAGVWGIAHAHFGNIFSVDVTKFDVIMIFVVPYVMKRLEKKLLRETKKGTRIVVETFPFPNWKPIKTSKSMYVYEK